MHHSSKLERAVTDDDSKLDRAFADSRTSASYSASGSSREILRFFRGGIVICSLDAMKV